MANHTNLTLVSILLCWTCSTCTCSTLGDHYNVASGRRMNAPTLASHNVASTRSKCAVLCTKTWLCVSVTVTRRDDDMYTCELHGCMTPLDELEVHSQSSVFYHSNATGLCDPCSDHPCRNGGTCVALTSHTYECQCHPEYNGTICEIYPSSRRVTVKTADIDYAGTDSNVYITLHGADASSARTTMDHPALNDHEQNRYGSCIMTSRAVSCCYRSVEFC